MPAIVNLRHLEQTDLEVDGELAVGELDIETRDPALQVEQPLTYDLTVQKLEEGLVVSGHLCLPLSCECVRCLKAFEHTVEIQDWRLHLPFEGEEAVTVSNDCVDLTPYMREDILLEFPQHPLCDPECRGLPSTQGKKPGETSDSEPEQGASSAWAELNKLKLKE